MYRADIDEIITTSTEYFIDLLVLFFILFLKNPIEQQAFSCTVDFKFGF